MASDLENAIRWIENAPPCILQFYPSNYHKASWWTNQIFDSILEEIKKGNQDAMKLGCQLIIDDPNKIPFGKIIKSNIGRALKAKANLIPENERQKIIKKVFSLIKAGIVPQEVKVYCKLIDKFGIEKYFEETEEINPANQYVQALKDYLLASPH